MLKEYTDIEKISESHNIYLVRSLQDKSLYVKKILGIYDKNVYDWLYKHNIEGIPKIKEYYENNGTLFVIEEYITGKTLDDILNTKGHLNEKEVKQIVLHICHILKQITDIIPLVHRDIKPSNIIISNDIPYLIDFNTAKIIYEEKTRDTILLGTQGYAAPEQYGFASSNIQTDIFAIGVLMKELLTGTNKLNDNYDSSLKPIIQKCTMMDPKDRYQNYETLIKKLRSDHHFKMSNQQQSNHSFAIHDYLPIGFRSKNIFYMCLATFWYIVIIFSASCMNVEGTYGTKLTIERIIFVASFLVITFYSGNYLNCQERLGLKKSKSKSIQFIKIFFIDIMILMIILIIKEIILNGY